jgi:hypothetical protein
MSSDVGSGAQPPGVIMTRRQLVASGLIAGVAIGVGGAPARAAAASTSAAAPAEAAASILAAAAALPANGLAAQDWAQLAARKVGSLSGTQREALADLVAAEPEIVKLSPREAGNRLREMLLAGIPYPTERLSRAEVEKQHATRVAAIKSTPNLPPKGVVLTPETMPLPPRKVDPEALLALVPRPDPKLAPRAIVASRAIAAVSSLLEPQLDTDVRPLPLVFGDL